MEGTEKLRQAVAANDGTLTVAFTGHRPKGLFGYGRRADYTDLKRRVMALLAALAKACGARRLVCVSGAAQGADQVAFWAARTMQAEGTGGLEVRTIVCVPFEGYERRWGEQTLFGQREYRQMLAAADEVRVACENVDTSERRQVTRALFARNERMLDAADALVAISSFELDAVPERGGTAGCVRSAMRRGMPTFRANPLAW